MSEMDKTVAYYMDSADEDFGVASRLFDGKDYGYSLFFCHLAMEKLIKAILVKSTDKHAPHSHDLSALAKQAGVVLTADQVTELNTLTTFNIAGRYDDEKREFRKNATKDYSEKYLKITEHLILWLKENYLKKS